MVIAGVGEICRELLWQRRRVYLTIEVAVSRTPAEWVFAGGGDGVEVVKVLSSEREVRAFGADCGALPDRSAVI